MPNKIDVIGKRFNRLLVVGEGQRTKANRRTVHCRCDCGATIDVDPRDLMRGQTGSCGCFHKEQVRQAAGSRTLHGNARKGHASPTYQSWLGAKKRCLNPAEPKFPDYGGRGIKICQEWERSFDTFLNDMGPRPSRAHTLDRINVNGHYEPGNCRWATALEQSRNKKYHRFVIYDGKEVPLSQACAEAGVNYRSALYRLNHGKDWMPLPPAPEAGQ